MVAVLPAAAVVVFVVVMVVTVFVVVMRQLKIPRRPLKAQPGKDHRACRHNQKRATQVNPCEGRACDAVERGQRGQIHQRSGGVHAQADRHRRPGSHQPHQHGDDAARAKRREQPQRKGQQIAPDTFEPCQPALHPAGVDKALQPEHHKQNHQQQQINLKQIGEQVTQKFDRLFPARQNGS